MGLYIVSTFIVLMFLVFIYLICQQKQSFPKSFSAINERAAQIRIKQEYISKINIIKTIIFELFTWKGRISRSRFILNIFIIYFPAISPFFLFPDKYFDIFIFTLPIIIPLQIFNIIKRLHDSGREGFWWFIALVPYIGALYLIFLTFILPGTKGPNKYGDDPLTRSINKELF